MHILNNRDYESSADSLQARGDYALIDLPDINSSPAVEEHLIALDILPMEQLPGVIFIQGDFTEDEPLALLEEAMAGHNVDLVLSDMAPNMSGMGAVDQPRAMYLAELALDFASNWLEPGGSFVVKVFHGEGFDDYVRQTRTLFEKVQIRKPKASRPRSREVYILGHRRKLQ